MVPKDVAIGSVAHILPLVVQAKTCLARPYYDKDVAAKLSARYIRVRSPTDENANVQLVQEERPLATSAAAPAIPIMELREEHRRCPPPQRTTKSAVFEIVRG